MSERDPRFRMRSMAITVLLLTFVAGGLVGIAVDRVLISGPTAPADGGTRPTRIGGPPGLRGGRIPGGIFASGGGMAERLGLSPEQQERIDSVLAADRRKADAMLRQIRPLLQARYDSTTAAILGVLSPEQRAEFEAIRRERREQIRARGRRAPPPDGPG